MKILLVILMLAPLTMFSQDTIPISSGCWKEYKHENLPYPESEHCPLILCPESSVICFMKEDNEIYTSHDGWRRTADNQLEMGEAGVKFYILLENDSELHLQSIEHSDFKIYLKK
jgi:hypothetical protein